MIPTLLIIVLLFACLAFSDTLLHGIDVSKPEKKKPPVKRVGIVLLTLQTKSTNMENYIFEIVCLCGVLAALFTPKKRK